jgi:hypothetical protein
MYQLSLQKSPDQGLDRVIRTADGAHIPFDPANTDYAAYLSWLEEGNEPLPAPEPPAPQELTIQEKLQSAGLTIEELKEALGL